jgi:hypothetical protein
MNKITITLIAAILFTSCSNIERTSNIDQMIGQAKIAGIGDVVFRINKERNLKNAFGKADIFGRKTNEGYSELRYAGVEPNGEVVLFRKDVQIITNETTMSRTPVTTTAASSNTAIAGNYSGTAASGTVNANSRTTSSSANVGAVSHYHIIVPPETIPIRVPNGVKRVPVEGYVVEILSANSTALEFRIVKN